MKLNNTTQRRVILETLCSLKTHPTAEELYEKVRSKLPSISLGTVYRNLERLSKAAKILKLEHSGKQMRFDGNTENHYHLRCNRCDKLEDVPDEYMGETDRVLKKMMNSLECDGYRLELKGLCSKCAKNNKYKGKL